MGAYVLCFYVSIAEFIGALHSTCPWLCQRKAREAMREKMRLEAEAKKEQARVEAEEREQRLAAARAKRQEEEPDVDSSDEELSDY